jgi:hypothetical protein
MGRGRAKAKQQKVARDLKYNSQSTDLDALQRELGGGATGTFVHDGVAKGVDDSDDADEVDDGYDDDRWTSTGR